MADLAPFVLVPLAGALTGVALYVAGASGRTSLLAGIVAAFAGAAVGVALLLASFTECWTDNPDPSRPPSWPWSPRRELCADDSPEALGALTLLLVPAVLVTVGTFLRMKRRNVVGWLAYAALPMTLALPTLYIAALPVYRLDEHPVLHEPLLRPGAPGHPPRVCYVYGIAFGPREVSPQPDTKRICVDLEPTREAVTLTSRYDQGRTSWDLEWMGKGLTEEGLPVEPGITGIPGLNVTRVYSLPDREARVGATLVE